MLAGCGQARRAVCCISATGVIRGVAHGAELTLYTQTQLSGLQKQAQQATGLQVVGVALELLGLQQLVQADPTLHLTAAPFLQLARTWGVLGLEDGRQSWDELNWRQLCRIQQILLQAQTHGKLRHRHGTSGGWGNQATLCLGRPGWT
jgi:hypothetical protein